ncbi:MAG: nucleotidyltransferase domain-containing protein [Thermoproteota archaeon]
MSGLEKLLGENLISVVLFGSIARGDYREDSDIDLIVVAEGLPLNFSKRIDLFIPLAEESRRRSTSHPFIQVYPLRREEAVKNRPIYLDLLTDAVILYDKDCFIAEVLKKLWKRLMELGAEKVRLEDGSWMWVLKPGLKFGEVVEI